MRQEGFYKYTKRIKRTHSSVQGPYAPMQNETAEESKRSDENLDTTSSDELGECVICMTNLLFEPDLENNQPSQ